MKLKKVDEEEFEGEIYECPHGYIVILYECGNIEDEVYFEENLEDARKLLFGEA